MDTATKTAWRDLGDRFPDQTPSIQMAEYDHDTGERSETELIVTYKRLPYKYLTLTDTQTGQYSCAHGRVRLEVSSFNDPLERDLAPRLVPSPGSR